MKESLSNMTESCPIWISHGTYECVIVKYECVMSHRITYSQSVHIVNKPLKLNEVKIFLFTLKRALYSIKRALHSLKRALFNQMSPTFCPKGKGLVLYQKSPTFYQKSPTFYQKSPTFSQKSPTFHRIVLDETCLLWVFSTLYLCLLTAYSIKVIFQKKSPIISGPFADNDFYKSLPSRSTRRNVYWDWKMGWNV